MSEARPESVAAAAAAVSEAAAAGKTISCRRGAGDVHLDLRGCSAVRFHAPGDLTLGVDAGITVAALHRALAGAGQWLPIDAPQPETTTIGTVLAEHLSGPLRQGYGTVRDFTLGIECITAEGRVIHGGGRVVKNVAGYDLMKLLIGSRGRLGIISGANFKVFPLPRATETAVLACDASGAEAWRRQLLHGPLRPMAIELAWRALPELPAGCVLVRYAGSERVRARYRAELQAAEARLFLPGALAPVARSAGFDCRQGMPASAQGTCKLSPVMLAGEEEARLWEKLRDWPRAGDRRHTDAATAALPAALGAEAALGRLLLGAYTVRGGAAEASATIDPVAAELMAGLKRELDPRGVLA